MNKQTKNSCNTSTTYEIRKGPGTRNVSSTSSSKIGVKQPPKSK